MPGRARSRRRMLGFAAVSLLLLAVGLAGGHWIAQNRLVARISAFVTNRMGWAVGTTPDEKAWHTKNTLLARLETSVVRLPGAEGWGGGLAVLDDDRILYATRTGGFGLVGADGAARTLPFRVDLNLAALERHPVYGAKNFKRSWFRVTGIDVFRRSPGRLELLVGHHWFDPDRQCVELRVSRASLRVEGDTLALADPPRTLFTAAPCITFYPEGYEWAFEGHFSGGRIVRLDARTVLFSTGDHGWVGLRGYPMLPQDDASRLGKILRIDVDTGAVTVVAKGVRNPQGLTRDRHGRIWETEHGPRGGDELNLIVEGGNYGWPYATYGTDYGPLPWPLNDVQGRHASGTPPRFAWAPSIGVSSLVEAKGSEFPLWDGDLLVTSLVGQSIRRLRLDGERVVYEELIPFEGQRLRDIARLSDGRLALLTDDGTLTLVRNADRGLGPPFLDARLQQRRTSEMSEAERRTATAWSAAPVPLANAGVSSRSLARATAAAAFERYCSPCHSVNAPVPSIGPTLYGVVGRGVGRTHHAYSSALSGRNERWTVARIIEFIQNPAAMYPGTTMAAVPMPTEDRRELERFLGMSSAVDSRAGHSEVGLHETSRP